MSSQSERTPEFEIAGVLILRVWMQSRKKILLLGLTLGLAVLSTVLLWIEPFLMHEEEFEVDSSPHLGIVKAKVAKVALRPIPIERLARQLNMSSEAEALANAQILADRVSAGFLPSGWAERCRKNHHPVLCISLDNYFEQFKKNSSSRNSRSKKAHLNFSDKNLLRLQNEDLGILLSRAKKQNLKDLRRWTKLVLEHETCPRNFSLALARMWENHLDIDETPNMISLLDQHGTECMKDEEPQAEYVLMRAGLLQYAFDNKEKGLDYLDRAAMIPIARESYRVNFWRAKILEELGEHSRAESLQNLIFQEFPLSWQSIVSHRKLNRDPMEEILRRETFGDQYFAGHQELDQRIAWFYLLNQLEDEDYAIQKYFDQLLTQLDSKVPKGVFQHLARVLDDAGQHRFQIMSLNKLFSAHRDSINIETLRLHFPKPYYEEIDAASPQIDTALLLGLVRQESGFNPKAQSQANARGLLQVLPSTAKEINRRTTADKLFDSDTNILIGATYLMKLVNYFDGSVEKSLAAYNAGMGRIRSWERQYGIIAKDEQLFMDLMPYRETREYVPSILRNSYWYHRLFPEKLGTLGVGVKSSDLLLIQLNTKAELPSEE